VITTAFGFSLTVLFLWKLGQVTQRRAFDDCWHNFVCRPDAFSSCYPNRSVKALKDPVRMIAQGTHKLISYVYVFWRSTVKVIHSCQSCGVDDVALLSFRSFNVLMRCNSFTPVALCSQPRNVRRWRKSQTPCFSRQLLY